MFTFFLIGIYCKVDCFDSFISASIVFSVDRVLFWFWSASTCLVLCWTVSTCSWDESWFNDSKLLYCAFWIGYVSSLMVAFWFSCSLFWMTISCLICLSSCLTWVWGVNTAFLPKTFCSWNLMDFAALGGLAYFNSKLTFYYGLFGDYYVLFLCWLVSIFEGLWLVFECFCSFGGESFLDPSDTFLFALGTDVLASVDPPLSLLFEAFFIDSCFWRNCYLFLSQVGHKAFSAECSFFAYRSISFDFIRLYLGKSNSLWSHLFFSLLPCLLVFLL